MQKLSVVHVIVGKEETHNFAGCLWNIIIFWSHSDDINLHIQTNGLLNVFTPFHFHPLLLLPNCPSNQTHFCHL